MSFYGLSGRPGWMEFSLNIPTPNAGSLEFDRSANLIDWEFLSHHDFPAMANRPPLTGMFATDQTIVPGFFRAVFNAPALFIDVFSPDEERIYSATISYGDKQLHISERGIGHRFIPDVDPFDFTISAPGFASQTYQLPRGNIPDRLRVHLLPAETIPLGEALDQPSLEWRTSSTQPWFGANLPNTTTDVARPSYRGVNASGWFETTLTGPAEVSFQWEARAGHLTLHRGQDLVAVIGNQTATSASVRVPVGEHTLRWSFVQFGGPGVIIASVWVDDMRVTPIVEPPDGLAPPANLRSIRFRSAANNPTPPFSGTIHLSGGPAGTFHMGDPANQTGTYSYFRGNTSAYLILQYDSFGARFSFDLTFNSNLQTGVFIATPPFFPPTTISGSFQYYVPGSQELNAHVTSANPTPLVRPVVNIGGDSDFFPAINGIARIPLAYLPQNESGEYTLIASAANAPAEILRGNRGNLVTDFFFTLTPPAPMSLAEALESSNIRFELDGDLPWFGIPDPSVPTGDVLRSPYLLPGEFAFLSALATGPGILTFRWRADSAPQVYFRVGDRPLTVSPTADWTTVTIPIPRGEIPLAWSVWSSTGGVVFLDEFVLQPIVAAPVATEILGLELQRFNPSDRIRILLAPTSPTEGLAYSPYSGYANPYTLSHTPESDLVFAYNGSPSVTQLSFPANSRQGVYRFESFQTEFGTATILGPDDPHVAFNVTTTGTGNLYEPTLTISGFGTIPIRNQLRIPRAWITEPNISITFRAHNVPAQTIQHTQANLPRVINFTATPPAEIPIPDAVETPALQWNAANDTPWIGLLDDPMTEGENDVARSGYVYYGTSTLQTTVAGPANLSFRWRASANAWDENFLLVLDGGHVKSCPRTGQWLAETLYVPPGSHTVAFQLIKNGGIENNGGAWLDEIALQPVFPPQIPAQLVALRTTEALSGQPSAFYNFDSTANTFTRWSNGVRTSGAFSYSVDNGIGRLTWHSPNGQAATHDLFFNADGRTGSFPGGTFLATGPAEPAITISLRSSNGVALEDPILQIDGLNLALQAPAPIVIPHAWVEQSWPTIIRATARNVDGQTDTIAANEMRREITFNFALPEIVPLGEALDLPVIWLTGGSAPWFGFLEAGAVGGDVARSGQIGNNATSWIETTVTGPATISFLWSVSSEGCCDHFSLLLDSEVAARISGNTTATRHALFVPRGSHTVRWEYSKDASVAGGSDTAWLDEVVITPSEPPDPTEGLPPPAQISRLRITYTQSGIGPADFEIHFSGGTSGQFLITGGSVGQGNFSYVPGATSARLILTYTDFPGDVDDLTLVFGPDLNQGTVSGTMVIQNERYTANGFFTTP